MNDSEKISEVMSIIGSRKTERKSKSARRNLKLALKAIKEKKKK